MRVRSCYTTKPRNTILWAHNFRKLPQAGLPEFRSFNNRFVTESTGENTMAHHDQDHNGKQKEQQRIPPYLRFILMVATSTLIMYAVMYLNTYRWDHVFYSETRVFMALLMGSTMAVVMLTFMLHMYENWKANAAIYVGAVVIFIAALFLVRSQTTVDQVSYMRAMIPHHSIAILTSERAEITDPRVRELADEIIEAQRREIAEMKMLIKDLEARGDD